MPSSNTTNKAPFLDEEYGAKKEHKMYYPECYDSPVMPDLDMSARSEEHNVTNKGLPSELEASPQSVMINIDDFSMQPRPSSSYHRSNSYAYGSSSSNELYPTSVSNLEIMNKMKDLEKILYLSKNNTQSSNFSSLETDVVQDLESKLSIQEEKTKTLPKDCKGLLEVITTLQTHNSNQENVIEYLKTEMVNLLLRSQMDEKVLTNEIDSRISTITNLQTSFKAKEKQSQQMIQSLNDRNSTLEDEIEQLRAENCKLNVRNLILEEEKKMKEEEMKTELSLLYIETGRSDIL